MIRSRLLATAALSAGLATAGFGFAVPSVALAEAPSPVGALTAAPYQPDGPIVVAPPSTPPSPKGPGKVVLPPFDPPVDLDDIVLPTKPPKPPLPTVPPIVVDPTHPVPPTPPTGPDDVTDTPPCPTHGPCGPTPEPSDSPEPSETPSDTPETTGTPGGSGTSGGLPVTGTSMGITAGLGALLLAGGVMLLMLARRNRVGLR